MCQVIKTTTAEYPNIVRAELAKQKKVVKVKVFGNVGYHHVLNVNREVLVTVDPGDIRVGDPTMPKVNVELEKLVAVLRCSRAKAGELPQDVLTTGYQLGRLEWHRPSKSKNLIYQFVQCAKCVAAKADASTINRKRDAYAMQSIYRHEWYLQEIGTVFVHDGCLEYLLRLPSCTEKWHEWPDDVRQQLEAKDREAELDSDVLFG